MRCPLVAGAPAASCCCRGLTVLLQCRPDQSSLSAPSRCLSEALFFCVCVCVQKGWRPADDASEAPPREQRALKSVTFQESVSVINDRQADMELESQQVVQVSRAGSNLPPSHLSEPLWTCFHWRYSARASSAWHGCVSTATLVRA